MEALAKTSLGIAFSLSTLAASRTRWEHSAEVLESRHSPNRLPGFLPNILALYLPESHLQSYAHGLFFSFCLDDKEYKLGAAQ